MDILEFPLVRRHTTTKHVNQLIYNNARYTSQAEAAAPRHPVPDTSDALLAPRRPHAHARARTRQPLHNRRVLHIQALSCHTVQLY